jgi:hypothetical protein
MLLRAKASPFDIRSSRLFASTLTVFQEIALSRREEGDLPMSSATIQDADSSGDPDIVIGTGLAIIEAIAKSAAALALALVLDGACPWPSARSGVLASRSPELDGVE